MAKAKIGMNDVRLVAADMIGKLYDAKSIRQLQLLDMQVRRSLEELGKRTNGDRLMILCKELDIEMDGVKCPRTAAAILNGIREIVTRDEELDESE